MRVFVSSASSAIRPQILAYAEFRMFAALARYPAVQGARVKLRQYSSDRKVRCSVTIDFDTARSAKAIASGPHAAATIDRAAEQVIQLMRRRFQPESVGA
jgi:hypothetical protein